MKRKAPLRAFDVAIETPWLITQDSLTLIMDIASRVGGENLQALETRLGRPLDNAQTVDKRSNGVAIVPVTGPIFRYANLFTQISGATSTEVLATDIQTALDDPSVKAIVLNVNSPGGAADGINELSAMIHAARGQKPIWAYVGGLGASGAYWIASAADRVIVDDTALLGSIGVIMSMQVEDEKTKASKLEIVSSQSPHKRIDPTTDAGRAKIQAIVDDLASVFVKTVARNRNVYVDAVLRDFGAGGLLVGAAAVAAGMADATGSLEGSIASLAALAGPASTPKRMTTMSTPKGPIAVSTTAELNAALEANGALPRGEPVAEIVIDTTKLVADARAAGAETERERIKGVEAASLPGHEAIVNEAKFDGKSTGPDVAMRIVAAERTRREQVKEGIRTGAPDPLKSDPAPQGEEKDYAQIADVAERAKAMWEDDADYEGRKAKSFGTVERFSAYVKANAAGRVRLLSKQR